MPSNVLHLIRQGSENGLVRRRALLCSCALALGLASACAGPGRYVWFRDLSADQRSIVNGDYVIGVGDQISVRVYEQDALSGEVKIRTDGKMALPLTGELMAAGKRPLELSKEIEKKLKEFIVTPRVTINVQVSQPITVTTVGEVRSVGTLTLEPPSRLVEALAKSGGLTEYADPSRIFVLRQFPTFERIRFDWKEVLRNEGGAAAFPLRTGDVIVVE